MLKKKANTLEGNKKLLALQIQLLHLLGSNTFIADYVRYMYVYIILQNNFWLTNFMCANHHQHSYIRLG